MWISRLLARIFHRKTCMDNFDKIFHNVDYSQPIEMPKEYEHKVKKLGDHIIWYGDHNKEGK